MKNNNIDNLFATLRTQTPQVEDEDLFVDSIMDSLPELDEQPAASSKVITMLTIVRTLSSMAAAVLIGLFFFVHQGADASTERCEAQEQFRANYGNTYQSLSTASTPNDVMERYAEIKARKSNINRLISMYK